MCSPLTKVRAAATYQDVWFEYYDQARHPTCAGLGTLSARYIEDRFRRISPVRQRIVEAGAGRSIIAELLGDHSTNELVLVDSSEGMLSHSAGLVDPNRMLVADAGATGLPTSSVDIVVSSLGDPYNSKQFWREVARLLRPGGVCLFTTPSWAWASVFRTLEGRDSAEFLAANGDLLSLPSIVVTEKEQRAMWREADLDVLEVVGATAQDLSGPTPPKLLQVPDHVPVLTAAMLRR